MKASQSIGIGQLFPPGTPTADIVSYINNWVDEHRKELI